ncbi:hypothetical protein D3C79_955070 [compost metagenome]
MKHLVSAGQSPLYYIHSKVTLRLTLRERKEVSLDYLAGEGNKASFDKQTIKLINDIEELEPSLKEKLVFLANAIIRDTKTGKAYSQ